MPYRKIVFLDIDGVVLPDRARYLPTQTRPILKVFDPCSVSLLNQACHQRKLKIVIHSSWLRYWHENEEVGFPTVRDWCIGQGIKAGHFHPDSQCDPSLHWRYDRIDEWLSRHKEVNKFIILDDDKPDEGYSRANRLILCNPNEGISMEVYRRLLTDDFR